MYEMKNIFNKGENMRIQSINNNYQNECKNKNPNFGILQIEAKRSLARKLGRFSGITNIESVLNDMQRALEPTKYIHGNIICRKNHLGHKVPKLQAMVSENFNFPESGCYEIINSDNSKTTYMLFNESDGKTISIYPFINGEQSQLIPFNDRYIASEENYKTDNSIELYNMRVRNGYKIFDIKDDCCSEHDCKYGNKYFPVQFGELFVKRILNIDNFFQAIAEGRAILPYCANKEKYVPYVGYIPSVDISSNKAFWDMYNKDFKNNIIYV